MATLNFNLHVDGLAPGTLLVREYHGSESLSQRILDNGQACNGFRYQLALASRRSDLTPELVVDKDVQLEIVRNGQTVQRIHGIARNFSKGDTGHHHTFYALTLVPSLERLSLRHNSRIFQLKTVPEILSILLQEMGINDYAFALKRECSQREFCVQYRETDLEFLHRLAAEEGLVYSFIHQEGKHTLLFSDSSDSLQRLGVPVPYNALAGGITDISYIKELITTTQAEVSQCVLKDYSFKKPAYSLQQDAIGSMMDYQRSEAYQHFDTPGRFKDDLSGKAFNQIRLDYLRREAHTATGKSNHPQLQAGCKFDLQEHLDPALNRDWVVVAIDHQGKQPQVLEEEGGSGATTYSNQFTLIPGHVSWRATPQTKPMVDGPMTAFVVGPEGEEIFCDEHGRVKVHFPWDRYSEGDENSSCWVRVSQGWAGSQYGMMAIPRIGHEVIVSFLNGDPDQPIITGRTYHAINTAPYKLPENKTKTVLRSESHQGSGFNELSFDDQSGSEQVYMHAQKDFSVEVKNDHTCHIKHDEHLLIENDSYAQVKNNRHITVEGDSRLKVAEGKTLIVEGALHVKTGHIWVNDSANQIHIKAGQKVVIEAGFELTVKAGGSFIKVDPAGVHIAGSAVNLNSGGSPGNGSGVNAKQAALPRGLGELTAPEENTLNAVSVNQQNASAKVITELGIEDKVALRTDTHDGMATTADSISSERDENRKDNAEEPVTILTNNMREEQALRLKSVQLKPNNMLDRLANRESASYKRGTTGEDVECIQNALIQLGFDLGEPGADGDFGPTTERTIKLFQKNYKPSNSTHLAYEVGAADGIVGQSTILGLDEALVDGWKYGDDEMDLKWLTVPKGQFTFDSEGNDIEDNMFFTRRPHVPNRAGIVIGNSGITIGRGLDLGKRTPQEVENLFRRAAQQCQPISTKLLNWLKQGAEKTKQPAYEHYQTLDTEVPIKDQQITRKMQHCLFNQIYMEYENNAKRLTTKADVRAAYLDGAELDWDSLPDKVRDIIVDLVYVGVYTGSEDVRGNTRALIVPAIYKDIQEGLSGKNSEFYYILIDVYLWKNKFGIDQNRFEERWTHLL